MRIASVKIWVRIKLICHLEKFYFIILILYWNIIRYIIKRLNLFYLEWVIIKHYAYHLKFLCQILTLEDLNLRGTLSCHYWIQMIKQQILWGIESSGWGVRVSLTIQTDLHSTWDQVDCQIMLHLSRMRIQRNLTP